MRRRISSIISCWFSKCWMIASISLSAFVFTSKSASARYSEWRDSRFCPTMIRGRKKSCMTFDIKSQRTNAGKGSNRHWTGANIFQPSQPNVQPMTIKKNPIEPTWRVIQSANLSTSLSFSRCQILTLGIAFFDLRSSSRGAGACIRSLYQSLVFLRITMSVPYNVFLFRGL